MKGQCSSFPVQGGVASVWDTPQDPSAGRIATGLVAAPLSMRNYRCGRPRLVLQPFSPPLRPVVPPIWQAPAGPGRHAPQRLARNEYLKLELQTLQHPLARHWSAGGGGWGGSGDQSNFVRQGGERLPRAHKPLLQRTRPARRAPAPLKRYIQISLADLPTPQAMYWDLESALPIRSSTLTHCVCVTAVMLPISTNGDPANDSCGLTR